MFLALALIATAFVIMPNASANMGLESLLAPVFTIGVGLHLESLIVRQLERRNDVNTRYLAALEQWEAAIKDATQHPDYLPIFKQEVWQALTARTSNRQYVDAPVSLKHAAVRREMERDTWAYSGDVIPLPPVYTNGAKGEVTTPESPLELPSIGTWRDG